DLAALVSRGFPDAVPSPWSYSRLPRASATRPRLLFLGSPFLEERREPRILPETAERRVHAHVVHRSEAEIERLGEPREGLVVVALLREDAGGVVCGPRIVGAGVDDSHGLADLVLPLLNDNRVPSRGVEVTLGHGVPGIAPQKFLEFADGVVVAAELRVEGAEVVADDRITRLELEDPAVLSDRRVRPLSPLIRVGQVRVGDDILRSDLDRLPE